MKDIVFYVADNDMKKSIEGLISRLCLDISYDIYVEPMHDPGVYRNASSFLRELLRKYKYAIVFLDYEGSGQEKKTCKEIEEEIKEGIIYSGWHENNIEVITFDPELEICLWVESDKTSKIIGWNKYSELKNTLVSKGYWNEGERKPSKPKEAMEYALKEKGIPKSSALYKKIAENIDKTVIKNCQDRAFRRVIGILERWFINKNVNRYKI